MQWISVEFLSDEVVQGRNAVSHREHLNAILSLLKQKLATGQISTVVSEVEYEMSKEASGTEGGLCKLPVVG